MKGIVIKSTGSWYTVKTESGETIDCKVKGNFRLKGIRSTNPVAVGDSVEFILNNEGTGFINEIHDRRNYIIRKASNLSKQSHIIAANIDQAFLVATIAHPETSTTFIDRFLATAEAYEVPVCLVFNKLDIYNEDELRYLEAITYLYKSIGYDCIKISAIDNSDENMDTLKEKLRDKVTLLSGNSGVGKSTLLNSLIPDLNARTAEISEAHDSGQHTTTFSEMFELPSGGCIIDTPGIKGFGTFDIDKEELSSYFREIFAESEKCRFGATCTHTHEPGCAVQQAVEEHRISQSRYASYLSMLDDKDEGKYRQGY